MAKGYRLVGDRFVIHNAFEVGGVWKARIRDKETGRTEKVSSRLSDSHKADLFFQRWCEDRLKREQKRSFTAVTFEIAYREWLGLKSASTKTIKHHELSLEKYLIPRFGEKYVNEVLPIDIEKFLKELEKLGRKSRTRQWYLTTLRGFFRWAVRNRFAQEDPTGGLRVQKGVRREGVALSYDEAQKLLVACSEEIVIEIEYSNRAKANQRYKPPNHLFLAVLISLHTGLRRGNVLRLGWIQVDLAQRKIRIDGKEMKALSTLEIPIHPELAEVLAEIQKQQEVIDLNGFIIGKGRKKREIESAEPLKDLKKAFKWAVIKAGLVDGEGKPRFRWHDLRHTVSTWLAERYPQAIKDAILGHAPRGVSQVYTHISFQKLKEAIDGMPRLLPTRSSAQQA
jgi:integrase